MRVILADTPVAATAGIQHVVVGEHLPAIHFRRGRIKPSPWGQTRLTESLPRALRSKREVPPANRLLRQYLAKNADLRSFTQADLDTIAARINERPRKVLDWASSHDAYADSLNTISGALTG